MVRVALVMLVLGACGRVDFGEYSCPDGYVFVAGIPALGTSDFCAMAFEAKARDASGQIVADGCDTGCTANWAAIGYSAASVPEGKPFRSVNANDAQRMCRELGPGYDLMANREWMTIARQLERVPANWQSGRPGVGRIAQGNTNGDPVAPVSDPSDPYSDTGDSATTAWDQRRTQILPDGEQLWDFAGNVQEWIDWTVGGDLDPPPHCSGGELPAIQCAGLAYDDYQSSTGTLDSSNGVGKLIGGMGDVLRRGGQDTDASEGYAGIYALNMNRFATDTFPATGFRCVKR